jgi:hypothetical protein
MSALHYGWTAQWMPALTDAALRSAILADPRYADRVEKGLLPAGEATNMSLEQLVAQTAAVDAIVASLDDETLLRAGLYWCGPVLATSLQPFASLADVAPTRARLRMVIGGRGHVAAAHVRHVRDACGVQAEGQRCIAAWLRTQKPAIAARVGLRLAPEASAGHPDAICDPVRTAALEAALNCQQEVSP